MARRSNSRVGYRSAKTGRFIKKGYATRHKATTVKERIPNPGRGDT